MKHKGSPKARHRRPHLPQPTLQLRRSTPSKGPLPAPCGNPMYPIIIACMVVPSAAVTPTTMRNNV